MKKILSFLSIIGLALLLSGCGTVSALRLNTIDPTLFKSRYSCVVVERFDSKNVKTDVDDTKIEYARGHFADLIVKEIQATGAFSEVSRDKKSDKATLLIGGNINEYIEGDVALRVWVGFGAGSTYFKALVRFADGNTKDDIGMMTVDNNSWALGGTLAAGQTPEAFMSGAAKKIASEAKKLAQ